MIVDGHEDIAWSALTFGRDPARSVADTRQQEAGTDKIKQGGTALLGWPDWIDGDVGLVIASIYASPDSMRYGEWDFLTYTDPESAHQRGWDQLDFYHRLFDDHGDKFVHIQSGGDLERHIAAWDGGEKRLGVLLSLEGAEAVREPAEIEAWVERGLRAVGLAWDSTRYSGSGYSGGPLTRLGRELLDRMAEFNLVLDLSHMSDEASLMALDHYPGPVIASHGNPRLLLPNSEYPGRNLSDAVLDRLIERDSMVGVALFDRFLVGGWKLGDPREQATVERVAEVIDFICQRAGDARHVGIGSDFDGGFGLEEAPFGMDSVADLGAIGPALAGRGYSEGDILNVLGGNWIRLLRESLP